MATLDGYMEGPGEDIGWYNVDAEFNDFAIQQTSQLDRLLFGRNTYEMMASYWPTETARRGDPMVAGLMNRLPKTVFSRTLASVEWENARLVKGKADQEVSHLKGQTGRDLAIFGSSHLAADLAEHGLIDEFRIMVNPVVLGADKPLLRGIREKLHLRLLRTRTFKSGNVLLFYEQDLG